MTTNSKYLETFQTTGSQVTIDAFLQLKDICGRYGVEHVAWVLLLRQDDRNENEAQILQAKKLTL